MNNQEAIEIIRDIDKAYRTFTKTEIQALEMAIKALEQEPSGDLISRDELLKAMDTWDKFGVDDTNSLFRLDNLSLPHYVPYIHYDDVVKCIKGMSSVNPVPSGDLISRQAVLDLIKENIRIDDDKLELIAYYIENMKSVNPQEPKTGHWIAVVDKWGDIVTTVSGYKCSECGEFDSFRDKFCPNCGCRMIEPQESEE